MGSFFYYSPRLHVLPIGTPSQTRPWGLWHNDGEPVSTYPCLSCCSSGPSCYAPPNKAELLRMAELCPCREGISMPYRCQAPPSTEAMHQAYYREIPVVRVISSRVVVVESLSVPVVEEWRAQLGGGGGLAAGPTPGGSRFHPAYYHPWIASQTTMMGDQNPAFL